MFSETWLVLILVLLILSAALGHSGLLLVTLLATTTICLAWLWNRFVLRRVEYTREFAMRRAFAGERVSISVAVTNHKVLPVPWLRVDDSFPNGLPLINHDLKPSSAPGRAFLSHLVSLGPHERVRWTYDIDCIQRGFYFFGPTDIRSGDIFGVFSRQQRLKASERLIVYPRVHPLPELGFPGTHPFGEKRTARHIVEDPSRTIGVREYHPEDSIKRVHWKASARHAELQVKVYEPTITQQLVVFLNVASFAQTWKGIIPERLEQAVSVAASVAYHATERRFAVGLVANGCVPHSDQPIRVLPSRAPDQLTRVLEALAAVTGFTTTDIDQLIAAQSPHLALGTTLVVITTIVTENLLGQMLRLHDVGRRVVLVSMDPGFHGVAPAGMLTYHIPLAEIDYAGVWTRAAADMPQLQGEQARRSKRQRKTIP
jgi:uncharacterized protein (DUF58 family)